MENTFSSWENIILGLRMTTSDFLKNIVENINESIVVTEPNGKIIFFNKGSENLFNYKSEEIIGKQITTLGAKKPNVLKKIRNNNVFRGELRLMRKNSEIFTAFVICIPLRNEDGNPIAMVGLAKDITEEKRKKDIEKNIELLKDFNENIIMSINDGLLIIDEQGYITFVNRRFKEITGYDETQLINIHYSKLFNYYSSNKMKFMYLKSNKITFETTLIAKDERKIPVLISSSPYYEDNIKGRINVVTDLTEINLLKEELYESQKFSLLGTLSSEIAHEVNNPLGGIILTTQMLINDLINKCQVDRNELLEEIKNIEKDTKRCKKFINKLLNFPKLKSEEMQKINIHDIIKEAIILTQRHIKYNSIVIEKDFSNEYLMIMGKFNNLQQVFINLITNAYEAINSTTGSIKIKTCLKQVNVLKEVIIKISDTGSGISESNIKKIFDPFFTTKKGGTGLGLSMSKRIIEEHDGKIAVENNKDGGASFIIKIPSAS